MAILARLFKGLLLILSLKYSAQTAGLFGASYSTSTVFLNTTQYFVVSMSLVFFNNSNITGTASPLKFRPTLLSMPDLPKWMHYSFSDFYNDGHIYGIPRKPENFTIEVIATYLNTYSTERRILNFSVIEKEKEDQARYEAEFKFSNFNLEDIFVDGRLARLQEIFLRRLWRNGRNVHVTFVEPMSTISGRRHVSKKEKEGVVVRIGSNSEYSAEIRTLDREMTNIRNTFLHKDFCPKHYKHSTFENYFRNEFISDWCWFKLVNEEGLTVNVQEPAFSPILLGNNEYNPPLPFRKTRNFLGDFLMCVILPIITALILAAALSYILFGHREGVDKRNRETPSIQMVQYASIQRASNHLRTLTSKRSGSSPAATTPSSTLPRLYSGSPNSTLPKGNDNKKDDESKVIPTKQNDTIYGFPMQNSLSTQKMAS